MDGFRCREYELQSHEEKIHASHADRYFTGDHGAPVKYPVDQLGQAHLTLKIGLSQLFAHPHRRIDTRPRGRKRTG